MGLKPNNPQQAAGIRIDPPPSLAVAIGVTPLATAAADPPEDHPEVLLKSNGLWQGPNKTDSVTKDKPSSGVLV